MIRLGVENLAIDSLCLLQPPMPVQANGMIDQRSTRHCLSRPLFVRRRRNGADAKLYRRSG